MAYNAIGGFPTQVLPFSKKNKAWRKKCVDFGDNHSLLHYNLAMESVFSMKINYDLLNGKLHMGDLKLLLNPFDIKASFIPDNIQHYSIMNSKLEVLHGEESRRIFDYKAVVTNPTAISEIEEEKNKQINLRMQQLLMDNSLNEEEFMQEAERLNDYFQYSYQDKREVQANFLVNHYTKELDLPSLFNQGFKDAYTAGRELYFVDVVGGEPYVEKLDPMKVRIIRSGYEHEVEKADMVVIEDYWSPGRVIDTYYDQLSKKDVEDIEAAQDNMQGGYADAMDNIDPRYGFVPNVSLDWIAGDSYINARELFDEVSDSSMLPYDVNGNIRVVRVFWKSKRKIKKVKSYDPETGEEQFNFYPETYHCKPDLGEEEETFWINEAWGGVKIGSDIYVNMGPRPIQYNRMSNPSLCHFGIIGSIYATNGNKPFSLVDIMKPYVYLYDVMQDRLNKTLAKSVGKAVRFDFAKVPKGWKVEQWLYYLVTHGIAVENSYNEGDKGRATGVLAGSMNNATTGVIDASLGTEIQQYLNILEWLTNKIGDIAGISRQREGQISNRETVGGVERATLQSSHSTEWLFVVHDSVKRRVLECLLETAKICLKGRKKKFQYILPDGSKQIIDIDGDYFAECDYGILLDNSNSTQELNQNIKLLAQAALQNQALDFSTIMKVFGSSSLSEKQRIVELNERKIKEQQQQQFQQQMQIKQQELQQKAAMEQARLDREYQMHQEDLENKILVAQINSQAEADRLSLMNHDNDEANIIEREKMAEASRQFDAKLKLEEKKQEADVRIKERQLDLKK